MTGLLLDGATATLRVGPFAVEAELTMGWIACILALPATSGLAARALGRDARSRFACGTAALVLVAAALLAVAANVEFAGESGRLPLMSAVFFAAAAGWCLLVLELATLSDPGAASRLQPELPEAAQYVVGGAPAPAVESMQGEVSMQLMRSSELTPCGAPFDVLKRYGGVSHKELAAMILSERPLLDGRSPASRASDRTWVSRSIVHAPVSAAQEGYFRDYGVAARRIVDRLHASRAGTSSYPDVLRMVCGEPGETMVQALERMRHGEGYTAGERAEAAMVLFVAAGCSASVTKAVDYTTSYIRSVMGGKAGDAHVVPGSAHRCPRGCRGGAALRHGLRPRGGRAHLERSLLGVVGQPGCRGRSPGHGAHGYHGRGG